MTERISYFAYVVHSQRAAYEALGWVYSCDLGQPHSNYSTLYEWTGEGDPVTPRSAVPSIPQEPGVAA